MKLEIIKTYGRFFKFFIASFFVIGFFAVKPAFAHASLFMDFPTYTAGSPIGYSGKVSGGCAVYDEGATSTPSHLDNAIGCSYPAGTVEGNTYVIGGAFDNTIPGTYYFVSVEAVDCAGQTLEYCIANNPNNSGTLSDNTFQITAGGGGVTASSTPLKDAQLSAISFLFQGLSLAFVVGLFAAIMLRPFKKVFG